MKKKVMLRNKFLWIFGISSFLVQAQVGINTKTPDTGTWMHIDAKGNTSGVSNTSDDVVISKDGNIGIGTLSPKAKLDIVTNSTTPFMRIVDGKQGTNKVLRSDNVGNASWVDMPTTMGANYNVTGALVSYANNAYTLVKALPVSGAGFYQIVVRWWGVSTASNGNKSTAAIFYLATSTNTANNWTADQAKVQDQAEKYVYLDNGETYCFALPLSAKVTTETYLKLYIRVTVGGPWRIGTASTTNNLWNPSIVVYRI